jgi:hypothetical protein
MNGVILMIVIRSKVGRGKINQLVKEIEKLSEENKILIIDTEYCYDLFEHLTNNVDYIRLDNFSIVHKFIKTGLGYYTYFVLNLCVNELNINYYKSMEEDFRREFENTNFILTVQEHADSNNEKVLVETI